METVRYEAKDIETIADLLKEGKVVAFPTDTAVSYTHLEIL